MTKSRKALRGLVEGALFVAVAQVLSMIKLWEMPWGGSVVLAMVPLILFSVRWGLGSGLAACFVFGVLQFMFDGGFAGLFRRQRYGVFAGSVVGGLARFLVHYVVGATVWAEYMPDSFFGMTMHSPWFYSLLYNLAYMLPNILITVIIFALLYKPLGKYFRGEDLA